VKDKFVILEDGISYFAKSIDTKYVPHSYYVTLDKSDPNILSFDSMKDAKKFIDKTWGKYSERKMVAQHLHKEELEKTCSQDFWTC